MNELSIRYGQALFSLASDKNQVLEYQEEMKAWEEIFKDNEEFYTILQSAFISQKERKEILKKTLKGMNEDILHLLFVVIDNNRVDLIPDIFIAFNSLCNEMKGVKEGIIYSPFALKKEQISQIEKKISTLENNKVDLRNQIDKSLIGGVKVVIGDHIYDDSIKHHIDELKSNLTK